MDEIFRRLNFGGSAGQGTKASGFERPEPSFSAGALFVERSATSASAKSKTLLRKHVILVSRKTNT